MSEYSDEILERFTALRKEGKTCPQAAEELGFRGFGMNLRKAVARRAALLTKVKQTTVFGPRIHYSAKALEQFLAIRASGVNAAEAAIQVGYPGRHASMCATLRARGYTPPPRVHPTSEDVFGSDRNLFGPNREVRKPLPDKPSRAGERTCLSCAHTFQSHGPGHRICSVCKGKVSWSSPNPFESERSAALPRVGATA